MPRSSIPCLLHGSREGIDDADAGLLEIYAVARDNSQVVDEGGGGDKAILDGHSSPGGAKACEQLRPPQTRLCLPRQTAEPLDAGAATTTSSSSACGGL